MAILIGVGEYSRLRITEREFYVLSLTIGYLDERPRSFLAAKILIEYPNGQILHFLPGYVTIRTYFFRKNNLLWRLSRIMSHFGKPFQASAHKKLTQKPSKATLAKI